MQAQTIADLGSTIDTLINKTEGEFSVGFIHLADKKDTLFIEGDKVHHAASTMKTAVMAEVMRKVSKGEWHLDDSVTVKNSFRSIVDGSPYSMDLNEDSGEGLYKYIGQKRTIYQLLFDMITVSSNLATNILVEMVSADSIMSTLKQLGVEGLIVRRGVEDYKAFELGLNNVTTAKALAKLFEQLYTLRYPDEKNYIIMLDILLAQKLGNKIPKYLPEDVKVAHKTGSITGVTHDSGIIFLPDGRAYVLVILASGLTDDKAGRETLAKISEAVYRYIVSTGN